MGHRRNSVLENYDATEFENFYSTQMPRPRNRQKMDSDDEPDQQEMRNNTGTFTDYASPASQSIPNTTPNIDVNALIMSMNNLMQQNATIMQMLVKNSATPTYVPPPAQTYTVMPDFSKTIPIFNGTDLAQSKSWIEGIESSAMLHNWPPEFKLQTAKTHLIGAAASWYEARRATLITWDRFRDEFTNTFVYEKNLTTLWKAMNSRIQGPREDLSIYFHDKVKLCKELGLMFEEQKEQIAIGLFSRELATMIITKTHTDIDNLYHDLLAYDRINTERRRRYTNEDKRLNTNNKGTFKQQQAIQSDESGVQQSQQPRYPSNNQGAIPKSVIKCYNCLEEGHIASRCAKPKREKGSCFICGSLQHQRSLCPRKPSTTKPNGNSSHKDDASTNLVEVHCEVVPSYRIEAAVCIGEDRISVAPILDTGTLMLMKLSSKNENIYAKPAQGVSSGLINILEPPLKNAKKQLTELETKQSELVHKLHNENMKISEVQHSQELQAMFVKMKNYHSKLQAVKKDIKHLHERSQKLKKRAIKLQTLKEKEPHEEIIVTKPTNIIKGGAPATAQSHSE